MLECLLKKCLRIFAPVIWLSAFASAADGEVWKHPVENFQEFEKTVQLFSPGKSQSGTFVQRRTVVKIDRTFESTGKFSLSKKELVLEIQKPFPSQMILSESGIVQVDADGSQMKISAGENAVFDEVSETMRAVVGGNISLLQKHFQIYFWNSGKSAQIGFVPKEKTVQNVMQSILIEGKKSLEKMQIVDGEGNILTYEFKSDGK